MINISTKSYIKTKDVVIDGKKFYFRNMGAGDQLDISQIASKMNELQAKAINVTGKDEKEIAKKQEKFVKEFQNLVSEMESVYRRLFTDENDGKDVDWLIKTVGLENMANIIADIQKA